LKGLRVNRLKRSVIILFICTVGLFFLISCATLKTAGVFQSGVFQSNDYIICQLKDKETPETLAKKYLGDRKKFWVIEDANEDVSFEKDKIIIIPLKETNIGGLTANGFQVVPILCYHRFAKDCKSPLCMPAHIFERQMKYLYENGYRVISFRQLNDFLEYRHAIPKKSVIISIDDGYRSAYDVCYPILKKYGFRATLFIYTDFINACKNSLTWKQLAIMKADGFEIGGHTVFHSDLTRQKEGEDTQAFMDRIEKELRVSKQIIDKKLKQNTIFLAFPYGRYNKNVLEITRGLGYQVAVTVKRGSNPFFADPLTLRRTMILRRDMKTFVSVLKSFHKISLK
jgi:peptidoglycan/xylan/chitin deacetylase (PgdA/CDA1 family)